MEATKALFKFECKICNKIIHINVFEILDIGYPLCCEQQMEIDEGLYTNLTQ